jgi:L-threonylcarbamoyladenylate synthase
VVAIQIVLPMRGNRPLSWRRPGRVHGDQGSVERVDGVIRLSVQATDALDRAVEVLRHGDPIALPTDTVYGLGAHAFLRDAVARLYAVKERPECQAIPLLLPDTASLHEVCAAIPPLAWRLAERFWPGGLSLVLPRAATVPEIVAAGGSTIAVRVPDYPLVRELCRRLGAPLAATSANRHGEPSPITAEEVEAALGERIPLILDGGPCAGGIASTVLDLTTSPPTILRPGPITAEQLEQIVLLGYG